MGGVNTPKQWKRNGRNGRTFRSRVRSNGSSQETGARMIGYLDGTRKIHTPIHSKRMSAWELQALENIRELTNY
jgi:hypothetical protein